MRAFSLRNGRHTVFVDVFCCVHDMPDVAFTTCTTTEDICGTCLVIYWFAKELSHTEARAYFLARWQAGQVGTSHSVSLLSGVSCSGSEPL